MTKALHIIRDSEKDQRKKAVRVVPAIHSDSIVFAFEKFLSLFQAAVNLSA